MLELADVTLRPEQHLVIATQINAHTLNKIRFRTFMHTETIS